MKFLSCLWEASERRYGDGLQDLRAPRAGSVLHDPPTVAARASSRGPLCSPSGGMACCIASPSRSRHPVVVEKCNRMWNACPAKKRKYGFFVSFRFWKDWWLFTLATWSVCYLPGAVAFRHLWVPWFKEEHRKGRTASQGPFLCPLDSGSLHETSGD